MFLAVARAKTVAGASRQLGMHVSTVNRRLHALEERLHVRLFDRLPSGCVTTEVGATLLADAERIELEMVAAERRITRRDSSLSGTITFSTPEGTGDGALRDLREFCLAYPDITVEIVEDDTPRNLGRREADVVVRATDQPAQHLVGKKLGTVELRPYASVDYLRCEHELERRWVIIHSSLAGGSEEQWYRDPIFGDPRITVCSPSRELRRQAVQAGLGIAMLPVPMGERTPLVEAVSGEVPSAAVDVWLLSHRDLRGNECIRVFKEFLEPKIRERLNAIVGEQRG